MNIFFWHLVSFSNTFWYCEALCFNMRCVLLCATMHSLAGTLQVLTGGVVVDAIEFFRTGSGDQLSCCTSGPTGPNAVHRKVTVHTCRQGILSGYPSPLMTSEIPIY